MLNVDCPRMTPPLSISNFPSQLLTYLKPATQPASGYVCDLDCSLVKERFRLVGPAIRLDLQSQMR
jgi:hypothetical protein